MLYGCIARLYRSFSPYLALIVGASLLGSDLAAEVRVIPDEFVIVEHANYAASAASSALSIAQEVEGSVSGAVRVTLVKPRYAAAQGLGAQSSGEGVPYDSAAHYAFCDQLRKERSFAICEPNFIYRADGAPNDARYSELWGMEKIAAPSAWDISPGSSQVVVAVIDTGVDYTHPDLAANIWSNPGEIPSNGIDDDQNGYVDDLHGVNVLAGSGDPLDDNNHGTHCSGTIGGVGNNAQGVAGVNWNVQLMGVKFLASSGAGSLYGAIAGIHYAIQNGAKIISASWGGGGYSQALYDAISEAKDAGVLFVAAAGNSGLDSDVIPGYPAAYDLDNIVSVAATGKNDSLATFSNYGAKSVDIAAPGVGILSTTIGGGYEAFSGTSMATPHVAGVAALVKSVYPELDYHALKARLLDGDAVPALSGKILTGKRLNAYRALTSQAQPGSGEESPPVGGSVYISSVAGRGGQGVISRGREFTLGLTGQAGASSEINVAFRYLGISLGSCSLGTSTIGDSGTASLSGLIQTRGVLNYARSVEISTNSDALRVRIRNYAQAGKRRFSKRLVRRSVEATCEQIGASIQRF